MVVGCWNEHAQYERPQKRTTHHPHDSERPLQMKEMQGLGLYQLKTIR